MNVEYIQAIFNQNFSMCSYSQTGVSFFSSDLSCISDFVRCGWKHHKFNETYRLVPPRVTLSDLADYRKIWQYGDAIFNYSFFSFLKALISADLFDDWVSHIITANHDFYRFFSYRLVTGPALEAEIILAGSDNRIQNLKIDILADFKRYYVLSQDNALPMPVQHGCSYSSFSSGMQCFLEEIRVEREILGEYTSVGGCGYRIINKDILPCYDVLMLIANGGLKFMYDFVDSNNYKRTMLLEYHHWISELMTNKGDTYFGISSHQKCLSNQTVLIIDSVYSGKTLLEVRELVKKKGGVPITLGLNPKSRNAISNCDYVLVGGKIHYSASLNTKNSSLFEVLYSAMCNEEIKQLE